MAISNPIITFDIESAVQKVANEAQKILVMGQMTAAGTATATTVINDIGDNYATLLGADSMTAACVRAIRKVEKIANQKLRIDVLPLDDLPAGTAAAGKFVFSGTSNTDITVKLSIGSEVNHTYTLSIANGTTGASIASSFETLINADTTVPVTASVTTPTDELDLTAVHKGLEGNFITLTMDTTIPGITTTLTAMTGGAGDPAAITDETAYAAISSEIRYQGIIYPGSYDIGNDYQGLQDFLDARFPVDNRILDGNAFIGRTATFSTIKTLAADVNNKNITIFANEPINETLYKGSGLFELDYVSVSYFAAIRALRLTENAQIGPFIVAAAGSLDDVGGPALASLPYMNTPFTDLLLPKDINHRWTNDEVVEFIDTGVSTLGNNRSNTDVITGQIVTTYLKDSLGEDDITFKYLNYFDTFTTIREYMFNNLHQRFAQSRLVEGDLVPLRNDANAATVKGYLLNLYQDLANLALVEKGRAATKFFSDNLTVTIDKANGKVTVLMLVSPVVQLRALDVTMQIVFDINL